MIVDSVMTRTVLTVDSRATVRDAARLMREKRVGGLVVVSSGGAVGILTERDLVHRVLVEGRDPDATPVGDVMSSPIATIEPSADLDEAAEKMERLHVKRLVVTLGDDVRGILTVTDLAYAQPDVHRRLVDTWIRRRWVD